MTAAAVRLDRIGGRFGDGDHAVTAVEDISVEVEAGAFWTIIGPSGCGKSTLLRVVADLVPASAGRVEVLGGTPRSARLARSIGFVFQDATLLPWRTASASRSPARS